MKIKASNKVQKEQGDQEQLKFIGREEKTREMMCVEKERKEELKES